jgi:HAE1 family hydrophobic/amphiphilic exporter-1
MKLPEFSVNKRVTTSMMAMILVVVGFIAFSRLGLDFFPDLEFPTVSVITTYRGAASEDLEKTITKPVEQIVSSVSRVKKVTSSTSEGVSVIQVEFEWGTNLDFAAQDIRDQIGLYREFLPEAASDPLVVKFNLAQLPIIFYGITGNMPNSQLKKLIEDEVAPRLERIDGVASRSTGSSEPWLRKTSTCPPATWWSGTPIILCAPWASFSRSPTSRVWSSAPPLPANPSISGISPRSRIL